MSAGETDPLIDPGPTSSLRASPGAGVALERCSGGGSPLTEPWRSADSVMLAASLPLELSVQGNPQSSER